ncbi:MAG: hypothetical protein ACK4RK_10670 [Gemmataceae bacterium]
MTISFSCPGCNKVYNVADNLAGRKGSCKKCGTMFVIPQIAAPPSPPASDSAFQAAPTNDWSSVADSSPPPEDQSSYEPAAGGRSRRKGSKKLLIALLAGFAFLGCCLLPTAGSLVYWFYYYDNPLDQALFYMPEDSTLLASLDVKSFMNSGVYKELEKEFPDNFKSRFEEEKGLTFEQIERVTVGGNTSSGGQPVVVIRTRENVTAEQMLGKIKNSNYSKTQVGGHTLHAAGNDAFCVVDARLVVAGPTETVRKVLERNKTPAFSESLQAALGSAKTSGTAYVAMVIPSEGGGAPSLGGPLDFDQMTKGAQWATVSINISNEVKIDAEVQCSDPQKAEDLRKLGDAGLVTVRSTLEKGLESSNSNEKELSQEMVSIVHSIKLTTSGPILYATMKFKVTPFIKASKEIPGFGPLIPGM